MSDLLARKLSFLFRKDSQLRKIIGDKPVEDKDILDVADIERSQLHKWKTGQNARPKSLKKLTKGLLDNTNISESFSYEAFLDDTSYVEFVDLTALSNDEESDNLSRIFDQAHPLEDYFYKDFSNASEVFQGLEGSYELERSYDMGDGTTVKQVCILKVLFVKRGKNMRQNSIACLLYVPPNNPNGRTFLYSGVLTDKRKDLIYWLFSEEGQTNTDFFYLITDKYPDSNGEYRGKTLTVGQSPNMEPITSDVVMRKTNCVDKTPSVSRSE